MASRRGHEGFRPPIPRPPDGGNAMKRILITVIVLTAVAASGPARAEISNVRTNARTRALARAYQGPGQPQTGEDRREDAPADFRNYVTELNATGSSSLAY